MLTIGVINNMPIAATRSAERQLTEILHQAAPDTSFKLRWFRLAGARPETYETLDALWQSDLDGLIVTGAEPRTPLLRDEAFWPPLVKTIDWAVDHTHSAIWSCLATHAAVLHLDGVERKPLPRKIFGLFDSVRTADHPMLANINSVWRVPHSRWNDLLQEDLETHRYKVLATSPEAGIDLFVKHVNRSLFVFIQSHPEYDVGALVREYRRDIARFQLGHLTASPDPPANYFDAQTAAGLNTLRHDVGGQTELLERATMPSDWQPIAVQLYRNWLCFLEQCRTLIPTGLP